MIQPLRDRIIFRHLERPETVLSSGVILPADSQLAGSSVLAEVLSVGPGRMSKKGKRLPPEIKVGDIVLVQKHAGAQVDRDTWGDGARSLPEDGILAIVESPEAFHGGAFIGAEWGSGTDALARLDDDPPPEINIHDPARLPR